MTYMDTMGRLAPEVASVYKARMLRVEQIPLEALVEDPHNARVHDKKNMDAILASLELYGQVEPLVIQKNTGIVIGGNGRLGAMRKLGWKEADAVVIDVDDAKAKGLSVALNRTGELAKWDFQKLGDLFREFEVSNSLSALAVGWSDYELGPILQAEWKPPEPEGELVSFTADTKGLKAKFDEEQAKVVQQCVKYFQEDSPKMSVEEVLVRICEEFLT